MGLINKTLKRIRTEEIRTEERRNGVIDDFFSNQPDVQSYQIVDEKEWIVDIVGSLHLYKDTLVDGELPFKIGKLTENLYVHVKAFKPSVIPVEMGGEIIYVLDEGQQIGGTPSANQQEEDTLGMGYISATPKSKSKVRNILEEVLTESIVNGYGIENEIDALIEKIKKDWENKNKYKLTLAVPDKEKQVNVECEFYVDDPKTSKPLDLTAIEKAVYMVFILHKDGLMLTVNKRILELLQKIYSKTDGRKQDDENGIMGGNFSEISLNSCRTEIRKAIKAHISNSKVVDEFAIEGYKAEPFKVQRATDELRKQIVGLFGLEEQFPELK